MWVDFDFDGEGARLSTGPCLKDHPNGGAPFRAPTAWYQGVLFLPEPLVLQAGFDIKIALELNLLTAALSADVCVRQTTGKKVG